MLGVQPPFGRNYGRSMVITQQGIVATSNALASQAGAQILARGGSAADAAIAANAVLGVVEPMMNGIGGDLFAIYYESKSGKLTGINASGHAPRALSPDFIASRGILSMAEAGIHAVTVPGAVDGWSKMHGRFGKLAWSDLFESAIAYSEQGYPISEIVQELWAAPATIAKLEAVPESTRVFLPNGRPPEQGELFRNRDLSRAYELIARRGAEAYYKGPISSAILETACAMGSLISAEDLASFSAEWVEPISIDYRGWRVYQLPPNGQGIAALEMLNIMETLANSDGPLTASELHRRIEAMKLAYADAYRYNADQRVARVPMAELISKQHARERARQIDPRRANGNVVHAVVPNSDTVYLAVVDREGNIASWIQSIYAAFGSGITVGGMGFALQNRGAGFSLDPNHPNVLAGGKRPYHTIIPGFMERDDMHVGFGIMGGANQPLAHAQFVSNVVDYGMNLQQALETPRFFKGGPSGCDVSIEGRVPESTLAELSEMGHVISVRPEYSQEMGRGQAVMNRSGTRTNYGASDPRSDGAATPELIQSPVKRR
jgi:gamma-glutamyltranspeptidase/glutathione hydrolase